VTLEKTGRFEEKLENTEAISMAEGKDAKKPAGNTPSNTGDEKERETRKRLPRSRV